MLASVKHSKICYYKEMKIIDEKEIEKLLLERKALENHIIWNEEKETKYGEISEEVKESLEIKNEEMSIKINEINKMIENKKEYIFFKFKDISFNILKSSLSDEKLDYKTKNISEIKKN